MRLWNIVTACGSRRQSYRRQPSPSLQKDPRVSEHYYVDVSNRFAALQHANNFSEQWQMFQDTVKESAEIVLGRKRGSRKKQWITQDTWDLIDERQKMKVLRDRPRSEQTWQVCNTEYGKLDKEI